MKYFICLMLCIVSIPGHGQSKAFFQVALDSITLELKAPNGSFKKAVFWTENASFNNGLSLKKYDENIAVLAQAVALMGERLQLKGYRFSYSINMIKNYALFKFMKDTLRIVNGPGDTLSVPPYTYDFDDYDGRLNRSSMFVIKLLATRKGNCHSLPYLYKILADEVGASCWLALAPNHIYIKNRCRGSGWYNTELTSGSFPIDAWIATSGYVPIEAIRSGIYMDTLTNHQAIALCVLDLAKSYEAATHNYVDGFITSCCDLVLQYHPVNVQALLLKAETLKHLYGQQTTGKTTEAESTYIQMEQVYDRLFELGYREMPDKMYRQWLASLITERDKYVNKSINSTGSNH